MQTGSCAAVDIVDKKNLPAGNYEETVTFETKEGASCPVTLKVIVGASSEKEYDLTITTGTEEEFTESDFYNPEFRVEKYVVVRNLGKKETRIRVDTSGLKNFEVDDQMAKWAEDYEEQDSFIVGDRIYQGLADAVEPVTGITNGAEKTAQSFLVNGSLELNEDENNEGLDTAVQIMVQVDAYQTLNRPVIDLLRTGVRTNYAMLYLRDLSNEADGYQFVTAKSQKDLKKGNYTAQTKITNSELNQYPELKYIPEGTHSLYCRAYKENSSHVMEYGEWSDGVPVTVKVKTPDAPVVQKVQVKKNDVRIVLNSKGEEPDGYDVVAARSKNGKEPSDYIKVKSGYSGSSKELILRGVPAGTWYIGVHAYKYLNGSNTKVLSKWAEVRKVTVKTSLVTGKPAVKSAKVSRQGTKRNVTVTFTVPKSCDGTDWVLAKKVSKSDDGSYTGVSSYAYTKKNQTKTTVVFKNVKPGVYYLAGRAYVKGYAKSYTKWSKIKKIVVK